MGRLKVFIFKFFLKLKSLPCYFFCLGQLAWLFRCYLLSYHWHKLVFLSQRNTTVVDSYLKNKCHGFYFFIILQSHLLNQIHEEIVSTQFHFIHILIFLIGEEHCFFTAQLAAPRKLAFMICRLRRKAKVRESEKKFISLCSQFISLLGLTKSKQGNEHRRELLNQPMRV